MPWWPMLALAWGPLGCTLLRPLDDLEGEAADAPEGTQPRVAMTLGAALADDGTAARPDAAREDVDAGVFACGPDQALAAFENGRAFCIDRHEVTQGDYARFLDDVAMGSELPLGHDVCAQDLERAPADSGDCQGAFDPGVASDLPVSCVDVCDALSYCAWEGKHLCGGRGGRLLSAGRLGDLISRNAWYAACAGVELRAYPYGRSHAAGACNEASTAVAPVGSFDACQTPEGVFDLVGNVREWTFHGSYPDGDDYPGNDGVLHFAARGGSFASPAGAWGCAAQPTADGEAVRTATPWWSRLPTLGFRCCSDPDPG